MELWASGADSFAQPRYHGRAVSLPDLSTVRNLGIVAHIDAGKTTISERILYYSGVERRMGEVHEGTAVMDWMEEERTRGITISAAATSVPWRGLSINLIDTPGHVDFTIEVERCMRVLDGAILVLNGTAGLQAQSETVWRQIKRHSVPYLVFVNQNDRAGSDYMRCIDELKSQLDEPALAIQYPIGEEREFRAVVDLVSRRVFRFREEDKGQVPVEVPIPDGVSDEVDVLRAELIEALAEDDEEVLAVIGEDQVPSSELLQRALRKRVLARTLVPVLCGAALRNVGIQPLVDAVGLYLPSPLDRPPVLATSAESLNPVSFSTESDAPPVALVFKLQADRNEDLAFVRIYAGTIRPGLSLYNPRTKMTGRVARVLRMHAEERKPLREASRGDVVAISGVSRVATGDTLCTKKENLFLERLEFPDAVLAQVVEPVAGADRDALRTALDRLTVEDPSFSVREDSDTGQWLISGMGELHLEVMQHRLERDFHIPIRVGQPRVAYREAVAAPGTGELDLERKLGGTPYSGRIRLELAGTDEGLASSIEWSSECEVPAAFRQAVEETLLDSATSGPRFGFPLVRARIRVLPFGKAHQSDSELGFCQAAAQALRLASEAATIDLLEPVMAFDISAPAEFMGGILAELNSKRADIAEVRSDANSRTVVGRVPLANMFGYSTVLRSLSQGRASFSLHPDGFRAVPESEIESRGLAWV